MQKEKGHRVFGTAGDLRIVLKIDIVEAILANIAFFEGTDIIGGSAESASCSCGHTYPPFPKGVPPTDKVRSSIPAAAGCATSMLESASRCKQLVMLSE